MTKALHTYKDDAGISYRENTSDFMSTIMV